MTGMIFVRLQIVSVIEGNLFSRLDVTPADNLNSALNHLGFTVWSTTVIQKTCRVPVEVAVQVKSFVQSKDKLIILLAAQNRLSLADLLTLVLNDWRTCGEISRGKATPSVYW